MLRMPMDEWVAIQSKLLRAGLPEMPFTLIEFDSVTGLTTDNICTYIIIHFNSPQDETFFSLKWL